MSSPTDTNQDSELYELCKEVYELTGWGNEPNYQLAYASYAIPPKDLPAYETREGKEFRSEHWTHKKIPLYTSDYLLEKLPAEIGKKILVVITGDRPHAGYAERDNYGDYTLDENYYRNASYSNEVRKALLKLTIALSEAGELK